MDRAAKAARPGISRSQHVSTHGAKYLCNLLSWLILSPRFHRGRSIANPCTVHQGMAFL